MANYTLSKSAKSDLAGITEYTAGIFGLEQAEKYSRQLHHSALLAAGFPQAGRIYRTRDDRIFRQFNCGRHAIFYRPAKTGIFIVRILHLAMDFDQHLN